MTNTELLFSAIKDGNVSLVSRIIEGGVEINYCNGMQGTPLCAAIASCQMDITKYLVSAGCDVNARDFDGEPPLCLAIRKGYTHLAGLLIASPRCDLNKIDPITMDPPLCIAVFRGELQVVRMLIDAGCNVNKTGRCDNTALHLALELRRMDSLEVILDCKHVRVNLCNENGLCPIHVAAALDSIRYMTLLVTKCKTAEAFPGGEDPLDSHRLDMNRMSAFAGDVALHVAAISGNAEMLRYLIDNGSKVNVQNHQGQTPLFLAVEANRTDLVMMLLDSGADPNITGTRKKCVHAVPIDGKISPLHLCVTYGNLFLVEQLVRHTGVDLNVRDELGLTPLLVALYRNKPAIVDHFLLEGLARGLDVTAADSRGCTPLHAVSSCSNARCLAQKLIENGSSVHRPNARGKRPLHSAVEMECTEVAVVLLDQGAEVDAVSEGHTPLHDCATEDSAETARVLLYYGADMHRLTEDGDSPLTLALENGSLDVATLLVRNGYNITKEPYFNSVGDCLPLALTEDAGFHSWLMEHGKEPVGLQMQCRTALRRFFSTHSIPMKNINKLPVPMKIVDFLVLRLM